MRGSDNDNIRIAARDETLRLKRRFWLTQLVVVVVVVVVVVFVVVVVVFVPIIAAKMSVSAFRAASVNNGAAATVSITLVFKGCS